MTDRGDWIQTYVGIRFHPLDPRQQDICHEDIAHALSLLCRYNGHGSKFYSVAEHCSILAHHVWLNTRNKRLAFAALMHDAAEAYIGDLPRPLKYMLPQYQEVERKIEAVIFETYDIHPNELEYVKTLDRRMLIDERSVLFPRPLEWEAVKDLEPLGVAERIYGFDSNFAEQRFLHLYQSFVHRPAHITWMKVKLKGNSYGTDNYNSADGRYIIREMGKGHYRWSDGRNGAGQSDSAEEAMGAAERHAMSERFANKANAPV